MNRMNAGTVGNSFKLGFRFQRYWDTSMALAFFFAEAGAGLFLVSSLMGSTAGMATGLLVVVTLKPYFHLAHRGAPHKSWRAILRPDRSWISRGLIGLALLIGAGLLQWWAMRAGINESMVRTFQVIAIVGAFIVMSYQGLAMAHSSSLALWDNPLIAVLGLLYGSTAGVLIASAMGYGQLAGLGPWLLVLDALALGLLLFAAKRKSKGGEFSVSLLLQGEYARAFLGLVVVAGLVLPLLLLLVAGTAAWAPAVAAVLMLVGFVTLRILLFKAAVFEPVLQSLMGSLGLPV
jgi:formate-dependent nitrite reductase membrane component NrfD